MLSGSSVLKTVLLDTGVLIALLVGIGLWWRRAVRRYYLPCPFWLAWLLENPYMEAMAGSSVILDRLNLSPGMQVLDVGCGTGRVAIPAARRVAPNGQVVALDSQSGMLQKLEQKASANSITNIRTLLNKIEPGILERNKFDRALLVTVLGEIPDREAALQEIFAALKPNGILSITEVIPDPHYQTLGTVRRLAEAVGFCPDHYYGNFLAFTMNFVKPDPAQ
ncbi:class I SAM-dependent methyltransferase [Chlorogloeopsis sp. ULAP01]|jgi:SAM-dependent methyltransferase|uniref:class I SAM-dependent methyltransferase n=1 Tax=Chlorogloeopsis sp. ULAP01 TaxID=3056483 RepID=UPI0025AAE66F|nr:class I SAM-dependent methyltransferase [Chlorogloeopsis sp. ULAP01]MDM9384593.1 class I SAM-dependent methyltransferase [Chlorogloeopsis sp. ULAP01]